MSLAMSNFFYDKEEHKLELEELHKSKSGFGMVKGIKNEEEIDKEPAPKPRKLEIVIPAKYYRTLPAYAIAEFSRYKNRGKINQEHLDDLTDFFRRI